MAKLVEKTDKTIPSPLFIERMSNNKSKTWRYQQFLESRANSNVKHKNEIVSELSSSFSPIINSFVQLIKNESNNFPTMQPLSSKDTQCLSKDDVTNCLSDKSECQQISQTKSDRSCSCSSSSESDEETCSRFDSECCESCSESNDDEECSTNSSEYQPHSTSTSDDELFHIPNSQSTKKIMVDKENQHNSDKEIILHNQSIDSNCTKNIDSNSTKNNTVPINDKKDQQKSSLFSSESHLRQGFNSGIKFNIIKLNSPDKVQSSNIFNKILESSIETESKRTKNIEELTPDDITIEQPTNSTTTSLIFNDQNITNFKDPKANMSKFDTSTVQQITHKPSRIPRPIPVLRKPIILKRPHHKRAKSESIVNNIEEDKAKLERKSSLNENRLHKTSTKSQNNVHTDDTKESGPGFQCSGSDSAVKTIMRSLSQSLLSLSTQKLSEKTRDSGFNSSCNGIPLQSDEPPSLVNSNRLSSQNDKSMDVLPELTVRAPTTEINSAESNVNNTRYTPYISPRLPYKPTPKQIEFEEFVDSDDVERSDDDDVEIFKLENISPLSIGKQMLDAAGTSEPGSDSEFSKGGSRFYGSAVNCAYRPNVQSRLVEPDMNYLFLDVREMATPTSKILRQRFSEAKSTYGGFPLDPLPLYLLSRPSSPLSDNEDLKESILKCHYQEAADIVWTRTKYNKPVFKI